MAQDSKAPRSFAEFIEHTGGGRLNRVLSQAAQELGRVMQDVSLEEQTKVKGELKLKIKFEVQPDGAVKIAWDVDVKRPKLTDYPSHGFMHKNGDIREESEKQGTLQFGDLKSVKEERRVIDLSEKRDER